MPILDIKNKIEKLVNQLGVHSKENNLEATHSKFIQPFFESLGWNFNTDVKSENFENSTINAFQIDNVTRFYLKEFSADSSLELLKDEILSCISYAYNKGVTWAIITNFKETRVYNTESTGRTLASMQHYSFLASEYVENFKNLSDLTKKQFSLNVLDSDAEYFGKKPKRISIDKQLLDDLLSYRNILVTDIIKENSISENDVEFAAQKILNRLIFIRSCGDRQIENRHLITAIHEWEENKNKKLIYYLQEIFSDFRGRYGSILFEKHPCDELTINDDVLKQIIEGLYQSKKKAIKYNFAHIEHDSLGKMYENYLGTVQQKQDGAYYTPSYISKYICQNTIIPYLSKSNVTNIQDLILEYSNNLEELESKIHDIKILDPACGTGEFLIRAIDVLLEISTEIQAQKEAKGHYQTSDSTSRKAPRSLKKKKSDQTIFQTFDKDIENQQLRKIIQNNIHGVDINKEAIEITQLNLFLKLATSSQQLMDVSKNILVGNSLIDDLSVDSKAFDWEKEFPEKFDVVIGNPPYVRYQEYFHIKEYLKDNYLVYHGSADLLVYFFEHSLNKLKNNGILNLITSNKWFKTTYGKPLRELLEQNKIEDVVDFGDIQIFKNATTYPCIVKIKKIKKMDSKIRICKVTKSNFIPFESYVKDNIFSMEQKMLNSKGWNFSNEKIFLILKKIIEQSIPLGAYVNNKIHWGMMTGLSKAFVITEEQKNQIVADDPNCEKIIKPFLEGKDLGRYRINWKNKYLIFTRRGLNIEDYPSIKKHLEKFKPELTAKKHKSDKIGRRPGTYKWYEPIDPVTYYKGFESPKIIYGSFVVKPRFTIDYDGYYANNANFIIPVTDKKLLGILNSKLGWFLIKNNCTQIQSGFQLIGDYFKNIPISKNSSIELEKNVGEILKLNSQYIHETSEKKKIEMAINIQKIDKEIDKLVYKLYEITDEEKAIIESSV
jgi:hypothetical protein